MRFSLSAFLLGILIVSIFVAIRAAGIHAENEVVSLSSAIFLSIATGVVAANYGQSYRKIVIFAALGGILPCILWSLECLLQSPTTAFLRTTDLLESYSTSLDLNLIVAIVWGTGSSICGIVAGLLTRAALKERHDYGSN